MRTHGCKERHGFRRWFVFSDRRTIRIELSWWSTFCQVESRVDDEGWTFSIALPPIAVWIGLEGFGLWKPTRTIIAVWDNNREVTVTDDRESGVEIHNWTIWVNPWRKQNQWCRSDPWWVRGLTFNIPDFFLGRSKCSVEIEREGIPIIVPMPEGNYQATAKIEHRTWKRPRWLSRSRTSAWLDIPKGIPHAGKGENSWDCGDDGLFGIGGVTIEDAIGNAVKYVLAARRRYGMPSEKAITDAVGARL